MTDVVSLAARRADRDAAQAETAICIEFEDLYGAVLAGAIDGKAGLGLIFQGAAQYLLRRGVPLADLRAELERAAAAAVANDG